MVKDYDSGRGKRTKGKRKLTNRKRTKYNRYERIKRTKYMKTKHMRTKQKRNNHNRYKHKRTKYNRTNRVKRNNKKRTKQKRLIKQYLYGGMTKDTNFNTNRSHCKHTSNTKLCHEITGYIINWCLTVVPVSHMYCTYPLDGNREHMKNPNASGSASPLTMHCTHCLENTDNPQRFFDWIAVSKDYCDNLLHGQKDPNRDIKAKSVQNIVRQWQCATNSQPRIAIPWRCNKCKTIWDGNPGGGMLNTIDIDLSNIVEDKRQKRRNVGLTVPRRGEDDPPPGSNHEEYNGWIITSNSVESDPNMRNCSINPGNLARVGQLQYDAAAQAMGINFRAAAWEDLTEKEKASAIEYFKNPSRKTTSVAGAAAGGIIGAFTGGPPGAVAGTLSGFGAGSIYPEASSVANKVRRNPKTTGVVLSPAVVGTGVGFAVGGPAGAAFGAKAGLLTPPLTLAAAKGAQMVARTLARGPKENQGSTSKVASNYKVNFDQQQLKQEFYEFLYTHDAYLSIVPLHDFKRTPQAKINVANALKGYNPQFPFKTLKGEFLQKYVDHREYETIKEIINKLNDIQIMHGFGKYVSHKFNPPTKGRTPPSIPPRKAAISDFPQMNP